MTDINLIYGLLVVGLIVIVFLLIKKGKPFLAKFEFLNIFKSEVDARSQSNQKEMIKHCIALLEKVDAKLEEIRLKYLPKGALKDETSTVPFTIMPSKEYILDLIEISSAIDNCNSVKEILKLKLKELSKNDT
jgi:hypothetical protein